MGSHPINLAFRFLLELAALLAMGVWGWKQSEGWLRYPLAIGLPLMAAIVWGTFAVSGDPSRSGAAPIPVGGLIRLIIELSVFGLAVWALNDLGFARLSWVFGAVVVIHYLISYDRIQWLITQ